MMARSLRSGSPGVRLGLALMASIALHGTLLFPYTIPRTNPATPALTAILLPLAEDRPPVESVETHTEPELPAPPSLKPVAVPSAPTFPRKTEVPRPLTGQALRSALKKIAEEEFYPREAIARGLEGRVVLMLTLADNGSVMALEVAASSGHVILDAAATTAAGRIRSVPGGRRQVLLPVEFRLE